MLYAQNGLACDTGSLSYDAAREWQHYDAEAKAEPPTCLVLANLVLHEAAKATATIGAIGGTPSMPCSTLAVVVARRIQDRAVVSR